MRKVILCLLFSQLTNHALAQDYQPIKLSGFNHDVIAEGTDGDARTVTTTEMDALVISNFILFSKQFAKSLGQSHGLPDNGRITFTNKAFQLEAYNSKNVLYLRKGNEGELFLERPQNFDGLSILGLATEGGASVDIIVNYTDGTSLRSSVFYSDWFDGPDPVIRGFGRMKRVDGNGESPYQDGAPSNPRMYAADISTSRDKSIRSVVFHNVSGGGNMESDRAFIFAISGFLGQPEKEAEQAVKVPEETKVIVVPVVITPDQPKEVVNPVREESVKEIAELHGTVSDAKNKNPLQAIVRFTSNGSSADLKTIEGKYQFTAADKVEYSIKITASGYLDFTQKINLQTSWPANNELNFALQPIEVGTLVNLKSVLFKQSTSILLEQSYPELDAVVEFLKANPNVRIELSGHTDNRGAQSLNLKLSNDRVSAVKKYFVSKGIGSGRITGKGYGASKPIAPNTTEESRKLNRRVEFVITGK